MSDPSILKHTNLRMVFAVTLMVVMGVSSVIPVFPRMGRELGVSPERIGLVIAAFTLPGIFLSPVVGVLADRLGRKRVLVPSLFVFGVFGAACALAPSFEALLALRFLQGVGGASLGVLAITLIGDMYSGQDLPTAMGYNAGVLSLGTVSYPAIGGALGMLGWRYPFALPLVAIPLGLGIMALLDNPEPEKDQAFGSYLKSALGHMNSRPVLGLFAATLGTFVLLYGPLITYYPVLLDARFDAPPVLIGVVIGLGSLFSGLTSSQLGRLTRKVPAPVLIRTGFLLYAVCFVLTPLVTTIWAMVIPVILFGMAQGLNIPSAMTLLNHLAPGRYRAAFMAANGTLLRLGQALGPVVMGVVYAVRGLDGVFHAGAAFALVMFVMVLVLIRDMPSSDEMSAGDRMGEGPPAGDSGD